MNTKRYIGKVLHLDYPDFLSVEQSDPQWFAVSSDDKTTVAIAVDPEPAGAEGFAHSVRNPYFKKAGGVKVDREGNFKLESGLEGYERTFRLADATGHVYTYGWFIDGKFNDHILNIQIATESDWYNGTIWESLVGSIRVVT